MKISLHQISNYINIFIASFGLRFINIDNLNYVLMFEEFLLGNFTKKFDLSEDSFGIN